MQVLLISTYELGRQPFGLASPAAWLRSAGFDVRAVDASRDALEPDAIHAATLVAFYLPMHTATRLALPLIDRVRQLNPSCRLCCYGLYAPLNAGLLRSLGVDEILGAEFEAELVEVARRANGGTTIAARDGGAIAAASHLGAGAAAVGQAEAGPTAVRLPRLAFIQPDRSGLPALDRYASLVVGEERRVAGYTEASRGCKHRCRHCPIVPVYQGQFRVVPVDVVLADIGAQVRQGARHITFGDPDFFNGVGHAVRVVEAFRREFPDITYDVTIKVEHLLRHREHLRTLAESGCLFVTSAVESVDDRVLGLLAKGHTRADFERAVEACRNAGLLLVPTFVAFTPWTTVAGYAELLGTIERLDLVTQVAPVQLALRLLIPKGSLLLDLPEVRDLVGPFDPSTLVYQWRHPTPAVDELQDEVMRLVGARPRADREGLFDEVCGAARHAGGGQAASLPSAALKARGPARVRATVPYLDEPWYC